MERLHTALHYLCIIICAVGLFATARLMALKPWNVDNLDGKLAQYFESRSQTSPEILVAAIQEEKVIAEEINKPVQPRPVQVVGIDSEKFVPIHSGADAPRLQPAAIDLKPELEPTRVPETPIIVAEATIPEKLALPEPKPAPAPAPKPASPVSKPAKLKPTSENTFAAVDVATTTPVAKSEAPIVVAEAMSPKPLNPSTTQNTPRDTTRQTTNTKTAEKTKPEQINTAKKETSIKRGPSRISLASMLEVDLEDAE